MQVHEDITLDQVIAAVEFRNTSLSNIGFCIACGASCDGVEPDAHDYECEVCGENKVFGAEELLVMMVG